MSEVKGIQNLEEVIDAVQLLGVAAKQIMADGKVGVADLPVVLGLVNKLSVIVAAVNGADQLVLEAKDIDAAEAQALVAKLIAAVAAIKAA